MVLSPETIAPPTSAVQTIALTPEGIRLLDQTRLPQAVEYQLIETPQAMITAIQTMVVRGAPAIGIAGAYGVVLSARQALANGLDKDATDFLDQVRSDAAALASARPTAVNLQWAVSRMMTGLAEQTETSPQLLAQWLTAEAVRIHDEDLAMCHAMGRHGAALMPRGARILTHCNAGALATAGYGTALGVVRAAFAQDPTIQVYADETRPRLQGARLTTWEMVQEGIPVTLLSDNMAAWAMKQGMIDVVIVGADRIAANGDTANKIGTYMLALAAKAHNIPFYVAAPSSTVDLNEPTGDAFPIEIREAHEVTQIHDGWICPPEVNVFNPAFDVTPAHLITAIITESGIHRPPFFSRA